MLTSKEAATLARAVAHPLKVEMLRSLRNGDAGSPRSAVEFSRSTGQPLGNCAYHLGNLRDLGVIKVSEEVQRRGAIEHRYKPTSGRVWAVVSGLLDVFDER